MKRLIKITFFTLLLALPLFANTVATLTALKGSVTIDDGVKSKSAILGDLLERKDSVITADRSKAQIIFKDETIVTVGKNSNFSISKYLYDETNEPEVEFGLLKGAMSTITGKIGKIAPNKFKVKTKTATIGIRGTNFTIIYMEDGSLRAYCTYGEISVTIGGKTYAVKQGYYLLLSPAGEIGVQAFNPQEIADMQQKNFGERQSLKGVGSKEGSLQASMMIDNTSQDVEKVFNQKKQEPVQDAVQISLQDATDTPLKGMNVMITGWSISNDIYTTKTAQSKLSFASDGSSFDTANSWVEVLNKSNANGEMDDWKFQLASVPSNFTNREDFSTTFTSLTYTPSVQSSTTNPVLSNSDFHTLSDLVSDDYMSWGAWSVDVTYDYIDSNSYPGFTTENFKGLWVAGEETGAAAMAALTAQASLVLYEGEYRVFGTNASVMTVESGLASLDVDFGSGQAFLTIQANNSLVTQDYGFNAMGVNGNKIEGGVLSAQGAIGSANGTFYGPNGESVGGNFMVNDNANYVSVQGVYQVTQTP